MEFRVRPRSSAGRSFRFVSDLDRILVGRGEVCDLRIPYPAVSFHHATIRRTNAGWELADNGSTNGTWHRGRRVHPGESVRLATGDRVAIPGFVIETRFTPGPAADGPSDPEALGREIYAALLRPDLAEEGPRLEVEAGPFAGRSLALPPRDAPYVIGRDPECDWEIPDREASRRHLVVSSDGRRARVLDEGSKNGVRVNGRVVREAILRDGDSVEVGRTVLTFRDPRGGTLARLSSETGDRSALCDGFAALERGEEEAATLPPGGAGATCKVRGGPG
ncbi:MAG: FHA domain-containing protein, partial [Myxococcota bacterium]|nr:FHA domain-containing protein [Myxococcota bacterium]